MLKILSSMATKEVLADLATQYEQAAGQKVVSEAVGGLDVNKRVRAGEAMDVVALAANAIDTLIGEGHLLAGSRVDLVTSTVAIAVREGAPAPDIGLEAALKRAVEAARTVGYSTGPSGVYLEKLFERWGLTESLKGRIVQSQPGVPVGTLIAQGKVELGFQQLSELLHIPGIRIVGPLPPEVQLVTTFSAGISVTCTQVEAVRRMLDYLASPAADAAKKRNGMSPA